MKAVTFLTLALALLGFASSETALAQSGPPVPPIPQGTVLNFWPFDDTNLLSGRGFGPTAASTNLLLVPSWNNYSLQVDDSNACVLIYNIVNTNASGQPETNLTLARGTWEAWVSADWDSGTGPGNWGTLLEVGNWDTNLTTNSSAWGLYFSPDGTSLNFSAEGAGIATNILNAPISWNAGDWHYIALTYDQTNTNVSLYLDGDLATNLTISITNLPGPEVLSNGFAIGSDGNGSGMRQFRGEISDMWTWDYALDSDTIADYYAFMAAEEVYPLPSSGFHPDDGPPVPGGGGGGGGSPDTNFSYSFDTNGLWLEAILGTNSYTTNGNSSNVTIVLHNTTADIEYELFSTTNLLASSNVWTLEQTVIGSEVTNFTVTTVPQAGRTNLYFKALASTLDTDGDGLPDWWELLYSTTNFPLSPTNADTGSTGVPDGYKQDSAGDGYNNLQKYQMGIAPNVWVTPSAPTGLNATANSGGTSINLTWNPSPGPVTGYVVKRADPDLYGTMGSYYAIATNSATNTSFTDSGAFVLGDSLQAAPASEYELEALYGGGASAASFDAANPTDPRWTVNGVLIRGANGSWRIAFSAIPAAVHSIRIDWEVWNQDFGSDGYYDSAMSKVIAVTNLVDNCYTMSNGEAASNLTDIVSVQGIGPDGVLGNPVRAGFLSGDAPYFVDGRQHLKESMAFLMRAAGTTVAWPAFDGSVTATTNFVETGLYHMNQSAVPNDPSHDGWPWLALDNLWPIKTDYALYNYLYVATNILPWDTDTNGNPLWPAYSFDWQTNFTTIPAPAVLSIANPYWIYVNADPSAWGLTIGGSSTSLSSGANLFGLSLGNDLIFTGTGSVQIAPGGSLGYAVTDDYYYTQAASPSLETIGFYFAPVITPGTSENILFGFNFTPTQIAPLPVDNSFAVTNQSPLILASVGQPIVVGGWAKQEIINGNSNKFGYLGQYFSGAYEVGTNGSVTSNATGILSPYGEFLPTEPGQAALVTMTNWGENVTGTAIVNSIKLQLDVNHDQTMDTSFGGPDNTSPDHPYVFWADNDFDRWNIDSADNIPIQDSIEAAFVAQSTNLQPDCEFRDTSGNRVIPGTRDLDDFARMWICGISTNVLTNLPTGSTITLSWGDVGDPSDSNPTIDIFQAADSDGGIAYLTNATTSTNQINTNLCRFIGRLAPGGSIQLNASTFSNSWAGNYFIWCGVAGGNGGLRLSVADGVGNNLATSTAYISITDIKQMYERWTVGDEPSLPPSTNAYLATDNNSPGFPQTAFQYPSGTDTNDSYVLFVHGYNVDPWKKDRFAERTFKRLYWQGYQGRFGEYRWPTYLSAILFLPSEFRGWNSGVGLFNKLSNLNAQYPGKVYLFAHSLGNIVAGEALRDAGSNQIVNTYIATEAAVSARSYDNTLSEDVTNYYTPGSADSIGHYYTNTSPSYFSGSRGAGTYANFFNPVDWALMGNTITQPTWLLNQSFKVTPSQFNFYFYSTPSTNHPTGYYFQNGTNSPYRNLLFPTDTYEIFAYADESYSLALGAETNVGGSFNTTLQVNLNAAPHNFGSLHIGHSLPFRSDYERTWPYWHQLYSTFNF